METKEEVKEADDIYPIEPRPVTVDCKLDVIAIPATVDVMEEANSVGSIKLLI